VGNGVRITALALAARRGLVLSGDLHGSVNLFAFPCPSPPAPNASPAPAAAIAPAAFLPRLYGGKRVTVMEWFDASRGLLLSAGADGQATLLQAEAREGAHSALTPLRCFRLETGDAIDALGPWDARLTRLVAARLARGRLTATDLCSGTELCDADAGAAVPTGPFCVWREACGDFGLAMCEGRRLHLRAPALTERLSASPLHVGLLWHALPATALSLLALDARGGDALAVTGSEDCSLHLWRVRDGQLELLARTSHRQHTVRSLSLHEDAPRGERGAATHRRFWLFAGGRRDMLEALCVELPLSPPHLVHVRPVASVGGGAIDRAASNAGWWRAADAGERLQHMEHRVLACVSFAEDAAHVVLAGSSSGELVCWELARGEGGSVLRRGASLGEAAGLRSPILCLRLLPSQPGIAWRLVCAGNSAGLVLLLVWRREGEAGAGTLRLVAKLRAHQCGANCLDAAWADDGSDDVFVASGGDDQAISVARVSCAWEAAAVDGPRAVACRTVASAHASAVRSVRWVGSRRLVSVGADQLVHAWRCEGAAIERGAASRTVVGDPAAAEPCGARGALVAGEGFELVALAE
jgi:WD40 repeat protein